MDINFYKEQLVAKEDMLKRTTAFLNHANHSLIVKNQLLTEIQQNINESISFSKLIQTSLLPDVAILKTYFKDADYLVSQQIGIGGDTIYIRNTNDGVIFCLLDATGHGIPGALLSISGSLILNEITSSIEINNPSELLQLLSYRLHKTYNNSNSIAHFEGIAFYYSSTENKLTYSSANGKAILFNANGEIISLEKTKISVGEKTDVEFEIFELPVKKGEKLLLFSDGLIDQFGGKNDKKYSFRRLKKLISNNLDKNVSELKQIIIQEHDNWKADKEQTDDISFKLIEF
jgi:serine phosphatase RsbU (regulator of sigma subunit)